VILCILLSRRSSSFLRGARAAVLANRSTELVMDSGEIRRLRRPAPLHICVESVPSQRDHIVQMRRKFHLQRKSGRHGRLTLSRRRYFSELLLRKRGRSRTYPEMPTDASDGQNIP